MTKTTVTRTRKARATVASKAPAKALSVKVSARKVAPPLMSHATLILLRRSLRRSLKRVEAALAS
jgi:hypothetical protein